MSNYIQQYQEWNSLFKTYFFREFVNDSDWILKFQYIFHYNLSIFMYFWSIGICSYQPIRTFESSDLQELLDPGELICSLWIVWQCPLYLTLFGVVPTGHLIER